MNKNSVERELLFMYAVDYCGFQNAGFNFDLHKRYQIDTHIENGKEIRQLKLGFDGLQKSRKSYWNNARFFGDNISALTMLIGENGAGKTTFMRLLILWLSLLSVGEEPKEMGLLLFRERNVEEDRLFYICFGGLSVETTLLQEKECSVEDIKTYLQKVSLVYYTDTMTDCGTGQIGNEEAEKYLKDWSLLQRLANYSSWFIPKGYTAFVRNKAWFRKIDFQPQIDLYLSLNTKQRIDFPLHVLKFQYQEKNITDYSDGSETGLEWLWPEWGEYQWNKDGNVIPALLICDIMYGFMSHLFAKKYIYGDNWSTIKDTLYRSIQQVRALLIHYGTQKKESILSLLAFAMAFIDNISQQVMVLCPNQWSELNDICIIVKEVFSAIGDVINISFFEQFVFVEEQSLSEGKIWTIDISTFPTIEQEQTTINTIRRFFCAFDKVASLKQACWFEWQNPSSGGKNFVNLQTVIQTEKINVAYDDGHKNGKNIWFLFDEPDNTFHPRWKRIIVQTILDMCISADIYVQLWISTHSPILLSDVPKQAAIFLKRVDTNKRICNSPYSPFAQQIYRMYQDAFFMEDGAIGSFAEHKIDEALRDKKEKLCQIIDILDEPLLKGYLKMVLRGGE